MADYYSEYSYMIPAAEHLRPAIQALIDNLDEIDFELAEIGNNDQVAEILSDSGVSEDVKNDLMYILGDGQVATLGENFVIQEDFEDEKGKGFFIWNSGQYGADDEIVGIVQRILEKSGRDDIVFIEQAHYCSKPRLDGFGGSVVMITSDDVDWFTTPQWIANKMKERAI